MAKSKPVHAKLTDSKDHNGQDKYHATKFRRAETLWKVKNKKTKSKNIRAEFITFLTDDYYNKTIDTLTMNEIKQYSALKSIKED